MFLVSASALTSKGRASSAMSNRTLKSKIHFWLVNLLLLATAVLLSYGLTMPLITFKQLIFFTNTFSVMSGVKALYTEQQYLLFFIVFLFSIVIPIIKLLILVLNWNFPVSHQHLRSKVLSLSTSIARWSMLDVFAVAVFVVLMKINLIAEVETHRGLVIFTVAVLSLMVLTTYINHHIRKWNQS